MQLSLIIASIGAVPIWLVVMMMTSLCESTETTEAESNFNCEVMGNHSVPGSCSSFIECQEDQYTGKLVAIPSSCGSKLAYSPTLRECVDENLVQGCTTRSSIINDLDAIHDQSLDHLCKNTFNKYVCANCKTLVNCVAGKAYPQPCDSGNFCYRKAGTYGGHVCYPEKPKKCVCKENNVFYQDIYNQGAFFICDDSGETYMHFCPDGQIFDYQKLKCISKSGLPSCSIQGVFAYPEDCQRYYACIATKDGWLQYEFHCPEDNRILMYNEDSRRCENPCHWKNPNFTCMEEGRFADPLDCRRFYVCIWDRSTERFQKMLRQCPDGFEWQEIVRSGSGRCTKMLTEDCPPVTTSKCHVPVIICP